MAEQTILRIPAKIKPVDAAYLAGMIDADGFITIQRTLKANAGRCAAAIYHSLKIGIAGTDRAPHDMAAEMFGGSVFMYTPKSASHLNQFQWCASGPTAVRVISVVMPYLRIKSTQAALGLDFQSLLETHVAEQRQTQKPPYRITERMRGERDALWGKMKRLNKWRHRAGRMLDGRTWDEMPEVTR